MRFQLKLAAAILGLGVIAAPMAVSSARAADKPAKNTGQGGQGAKQRSQRGAGEFLDRYHQQVLALNPTDEQKPKIEAAFTDAKEKLAAATKDAGADRAAIREKAKPVMDDLKTKLDGILTADQKTQLEKAQQEARQKRGNRRGNGAPGAGNGGAGNAGGNPPAK